ncbi:unannotated protein [freshwater metagenome]|jgi:rhodanese-related sulfurtransferase|uniref:Unannotated protein n=1 Tax=freshwater metagenome TaxID=449393 RepID=A0A6J7IU14_9ZZZZ|nr:rhodanese-like domain-containing protein [Actinomycetota bacterium]
MTGPLEISTGRAAALQDDEDAVILDVREPYERAAGHIPGSIHIPLDELGRRAGELDPATPIVVVCRAGMRSLYAAQALQAAGYDAVSMAGGLLAWDGEQRPLDPPGGVVAEH